PPGAWAQQPPGVWAQQPPGAWAQQPLGVWAQQPPGVWAQPQPPQQQPPPSLLIMQRDLDGMEAEFAATPPDAPAYPTLARQIRQLKTDIARYKAKYGLPG
ncbi:hypothetical protein OAO87_04570, partial [bacterium]|nr:hypothetical protein [bacterium]